jgi:hypothetical protein
MHVSPNDLRLDRALFCTCPPDARQHPSRAAEARLVFKFLTSIFVHFFVMTKKMDEKKTRVYSNLEPDVPVFVSVQCPLIEETAPAASSRDGGTSAGGAGALGVGKQGQGCYAGG